MFNFNMGKILLNDKMVNIKTPYAKKDLPTHELSELNYTSNKNPWISTGYFNPRKGIGETIVIPIYVTDYYHKEYLENDNTESFTVIVEFLGNKIIKNVKGGNNFIDIGKVDIEGEVYFSLYVIDKRGVASSKQFIPLYIINPDTYNISKDQIYIMKTEDLDTYAINNQNSRLDEHLTNTRIGLNQLIQDTKQKGYRKIVLLEGTYRMNYSSVSEGDAITMPNNFTIDMNGCTFKAHSCISNTGNLVVIDGVFDSHLINGNIEGNYDEFDFQAVANETNYHIPGESIMLTEIAGGRYCSIEDVNMSLCVGYNLGTISSNKNSIIDKFAGVNSFRDNTIVKDGLDVEFNNMATTDYMSLEKFKKIGFVQSNIYLGYGGYKGYLAEQFMHFYDDKKIFIETIKNRQFQLCKIPPNASYIRVTGFGNSDNLNGATLHYLDSPTHCEFKNIHSFNTRTCAMHPGLYNHLLIESCTFDNVAMESGQWRVTKLTIDIEDGYQNGMNLYFKSNEIFNDPAIGNLIILHGYNVVIEGNKEFGYDLRGGIKGLFFKDNIVGKKGIVNNYREHIFNAFHVIDSNELNGKFVMMPKDNNNYFIDFNYKVKNCIINGGVSGFKCENESTLIVDKCVFVNSGPSYNVTSNYCSFTCSNNNTTYLDVGLIYNNCTFNTDKGYLFTINVNSQDAFPKFNKCLFYGDVKVAGNRLKSIVFYRCEFDMLRGILPNMENSVGDILFDKCNIKYVPDTYYTSNGLVIIWGGENRHIVFNDCCIECLDNSKTPLMCISKDTRKSSAIFHNASIKKSYGFILGGSSLASDSEYEVILKNSQYTVIEKSNEVLGDQYIITIL